jgi:hypothetical protein
MARHRVLLVIAAALAIVLAGVVWARVVTEADVRDSRPTAQATRRAASQAPRDDQQQCLQACRAVMSFYQRRYPLTATHDGDLACYEECWRTRGQTGKATAERRHAFWAGQRLAHQRASRCARTCWRKSGQKKLDVPASGYREGPAAR